MNSGAMYFELFSFALCPMLFAQYASYLAALSHPRPHKKIPITSDCSVKCFFLIFNCGAYLDQYTATKSQTETPLLYVRKRLKKLDEYLSIIHGLQRYTLKEFMFVSFGQRITLLVYHSKPVSSIS